MSRQKVEQTGSFQAVDESGVKHTIIVFTNFTEHAPLSGERSWIPGMKSHKMGNGNHVNVLEDGTYQDIHTMRVMRRI
jgi:hypothetical protein